MDAQKLQILKNRYDIVGNDPALGRALEIAVAVAPTLLTVLIVGESGVGKETIPKIIHHNSPRRNGRYFAVNCGAIPEGTIDSELFGHERGSFTGAGEMRKGYFEEADGGTLFLDEIGELPMASQAKLLRVLQDGEFLRVGSSKVMKTDVRVVAATNVDLRHAVQKGKFRADLYYRLSAITVKMPSLRERGDDIPLLFRKFTSDFAEKYGMSKISLTPDATALLKAYRWPGNIRQLKNVAESVSALEGARISPGAARCEISATILQQYIPRDDSSVPTVSAVQEGISSAEKEMLVRMIYQLRQEVDYLKERLGAGTAPTAAPLATLPQGHTDVAATGVISPSFPEEAEWQDTETVPVENQAAAENQTAAAENPANEENTDLSMRKAGNNLIRKALERNGGNRKAAAAELGISERTLYRKIKELDNESAD